MIELGFGEKELKPSVDDQSFWNLSNLQLHIQGPCRQNRQTNFQKPEPDSEPSMKRHLE